MAISFQNINTHFVLANKTKIKHWLKHLVNKEKMMLGEINFVFTTDEELLKYNISYLNHNTLTDIITFDTSNDKKINGDIIISIERVEENAKKFKVNFNTELNRVLAHGILHLLGYKDKTKADSLEMRRQEELALKLFDKLAK